MEQEITPLERYMGVKEDLQDLAQALLIFGTHVHIGIEDREFLIDAMNVSRYLLPHVLALSTSSPFWMGRKTGLKVYRSIVFRSFPRTGVPRSLGSWAEFEQVVNTLVATNSIPNASKIWWDVRPSWSYPTLEFRICDVCTRVDEAVCIAAIFQAIVVKLWKLRRDNLTFRQYPGRVHRGEQVARLPLRAGRQADRLRQEPGAARPRADPRDDRVVPRRRAGRTRHPQGGRVRLPDPGGGNQRRPPDRHVQADR